MGSPEQAANFSLAAPFVAIGLNIVIGTQVRGNRWAMLIVGLTSVSLIVIGLILGIIALAKRNGREGVVGKAIAGTSICGLLTLVILISIPGLIRQIEQLQR
jgi:hypothetical protein